MASSKRTINHEEIKRWADQRGARPSKVKGTGKKDDPGLLRLNFPDFAEKRLEDISWDEFFDKFEENNLSLLYQEEKSNGEVSNFSKLIRRSGKESKGKTSATSSKQRAKNSIGSIMAEDIVWCSPNSSLEEAALIMAECDFGELPVVDDEDNIVGVITDRDITCRSLGQGKNPQKMKVEECMTSPALTIDEDSDIKDCLKLMEDNQIRRVVVVDSEGYCCGMVSQADIAEKISKNQLGEIVQKISKPSDEPSQVSMQ
jgi:CBS domain-containing protein